MSIVKNVFAILLRVQFPKRFHKLCFDTIIRKSGHIFNPMRHDFDRGAEKMKAQRRLPCRWDKRKRKTSERTDGRGFGRERSGRMLFVRRGSCKIGETLFDRVITGLEAGDAKRITKHRLVTADRENQYPVGQPFVITAGCHVAGMKGTKHL